jgi:hypothetical protein
MLLESLLGRELLSTDLYEGRHACGIHSEAVSNQVIVGSQFPESQSDPIGPRQVVKVGRLHLSSLFETGLGTLSTRY